ncbi:MAG: alpha-amylase/4-alpha-glucanotransferase domain-containing protein, partial [bacterium]
MGEVLAFLKEHARDPAPVLLMGDDGEKFGLWPGTHAHVWQGRWMEEFFTALEAESSWLWVIPPGEAAEGAAVGRVYLPTASYDEMEEWALPVGTAAEYVKARHRLEERADPALRYLRGGFWRQFLVKYPEINTMHKKMLRVSEKVWRMPPGRRRLRALDEVWQAQCNCPYWHGVFGGVYLPHIRRANFAHLIAAEALADGEARAPVVTTSADLDADGAVELELSSPTMVLWIDPAEGGGVVVWDWRAAGINLVNVLSRRREAYHQQLLDAPAADRASESAVETIHTNRVRVKEPGLDRLLSYDRYRRASFLDHLLPPDATVDSFASGQSVATFAGNPYSGSTSRSRSQAAASLVREASPVPGGGGGLIRLEKRFHVEDRERRLRVGYRITNSGAHPVRAVFCVETNWAITDPQSPVRIDGVPQRARAKRTAPSAGRVELSDYGWPGAVALSFPTAAVWLMPLETVSNSEAGFERTFQGLTSDSTGPIILEPTGLSATAISCELPARRRP